MAKSCSLWIREHRPSGSAPWVRRCTFGDRAEIVSGGSYFTYNVYKDNTFVKRGSTKSLTAAKTAASRILGRRR
jgi:hypothetical protein